MSSDSIKSFLLRKIVNIRSDELGAVAWSFLYFFFLLSSYYIVRPMRDEMGVAGGVENLQWLFSGTFLVMLAAVPLFGWVSSHYERRRFLPYIYYFFILNLVLFFLLFKSDITHSYVARAFFVWASVFNLFVISVFWSFMTDIYSNEQARRLFSIIAAGGTTGALTGPIITASLSLSVGPVNLLPLSALLLGCAVVCIHQLTKWRATQALTVSPGDNIVAEQQPLGGGLFSGIRLVMGSSYLLGICALMLLFTTLATFLYFQQAQIVGDNFSDAAERTAIFSGMDFAVNSLTLFFQILITGRMVTWLGLGVTLALVPLLLAGGFLLLGAAPVLGVLVVVQVLRRAGNYAIMRPSREMLYVVLDREEKYKAKNFIDTVVYRGGDAVSAWVYSGLRGLGLSMAQISYVAVPVALVWAWVAYRLGKRQTEMVADKQLR